MKNNAAVSVGLDIGTTKIVVMVGRRHADGSVEIVGVGQSPSTGVSKGAIQNISKTIAGIRDAVAQAEAVSGVRIEEVTVGIAGQYIRSVRQTDYITRKRPRPCLLYTSTCGNEAWSACPYTRGTSTPTPALTGMTASRRLT